MAIKRHFFASCPGKRQELDLIAASRIIADPTKEAWLKLL